MITNQMIFAITDLMLSTSSFEWKRKTEGILNHDI